VATLIAFGKVETLAEVTSLLHLLLYGLMCVAVIFLRRPQPGHRSSVALG
jgi:amino acid transporter